VTGNSGTGVALTSHWIAVHEFLVERERFCEGIVDIFSMQFLYALGAIILIDLVLAGDNAIVIALAARKLPPKLQRRAILWGTAGAIIVRSLMTVVVVWLLKIPGLLLMGGALLVWIAAKLLVPQEDHGDDAHAGADSFWGAMKTIVVADAVMGLDNVLAVAGAAHGSFLLVVLGLLISIPIVVWGSTLILKWVERFPAIMYIGAAVLAWTAVKMMLGEPLIKDYVEPLKNWSLVAYAIVIGGVLGVGVFMNRKKKAGSEPATMPALSSTEEVSAMNAVATEVASSNVSPVLIPVNDSAASREAVRQFIEKSGQDRPAVLLMHAVPSMHRHINRWVPADGKKAFVKERTQTAMDALTKMLQGAGFATDVKVVATRDTAKAILAVASETKASRIVLGASRKSSLVSFLTHSVTARVLERSKVPVELTMVGNASLMARYGLPAGLGLAIAALAID